MTHTTVIVCRTPYFDRFYSIVFQWNIEFPSQFCVYRKITYSVTQTLKDRFLKKMLLNRANPHKTIGSIFFYSNWKQLQVFKTAKFEFKVTIDYGLWAKRTQLWSRNERRWFFWPKTIQLLSCSSFTSLHAVHLLLTEMTRGKRTSCSL